MDNNTTPTISTQFLLDSCNHLETIRAQNTLSKINCQFFGQTTNPSLLVKNPALQNSLHGGKIKETELLEFYKTEIRRISNLIPSGSVSIEVYADASSTAENLLKQANKFNSWIPNAHIKFPTIPAGLEAAEIFVNSGGRVNMTLVFSQEQALAVHLIAKNTKNKGDVFLSPFLGRLDDIGINGVDLIANCVRMYQELDSKVFVLAASIRSLDHLNSCIDLQSDITTAPLGIYEQYVQQVLNTSPRPSPTREGVSDKKFQPIPFQKLDYNQTNWRNLNIQHDLTDQGLTKFVKDWKSVLI
jgi:transaldolase